MIFILCIIFRLKYPQHTIEFAFALSAVPRCLLALQKYMQEELNSPSGVRPHFPFEIRFSEADDVWLSPAYEQRTCWIGIAQYKYVISCSFRIFRRICWVTVLFQTIWTSYTVQDLFCTCLTYTIQFRRPTSLGKRAAVYTSRVAKHVPSLG